MKIQLVSDIHIESRGCFAIPQLDSDLIILAGDIDKGMYGIEWAEDISHLHKKPVIYVAGNHEYYDHDYTDLTASLRSYASGHKQLHFLENDELFFKDTRFLGCTLWTNYFDELGEIERNKNQEVMNSALNDHVLIKIDGERFTPQHAYEINQQSLRWLKAKLSEPFEGKTAVITHHGPSLQCNHIKHGMNVYSPGFVSNLDQLVEQADLWCYGHTHSNLDTHVGKCRLISNQPGYPGEKVPGGYNSTLLIEI